MPETATASAAPIWALRLGKPEDIPYVTKTWVGADGWHAAARTLGLTHRIWHTRMVKRILGRQDSTLTVAAHTSDEDAILGWSCTGPKRLYYVYARKELRGLGMAKALIAHLDYEGPITFTHQPVVKGIPIPDRWTYNPYANHDDGAPE